jgi:hypothetical protein
MVVRAGIEQAPERASARALALPGCAGHAPVLRPDRGLREGDVAADLLGTGAGAGVPLEVPLAGASAGVTRSPIRAAMSGHPGVLLPPDEP